MSKRLKGDADAMSKACVTYRRKRWLILEAAVEGLAYLHHYFDEPVIHRDIKTPNLLVNLEGTWPRTAAWCDLGFARTVGENMSPEIGSRDTMAPEVAAGSVYTTSADTYSFGVTLMEVYVGTAYTGDVNSGAATSSKGFPDHL